MTVTTTDDRILFFDTNGVQTLFELTTLSFRKPEDLAVSFKATGESTFTPLVFGVDFAVPGDGEAKTGQILTTSAKPAGELRVERNTPVRQDFAFSQQGVYNAERNERAFDDITRQLADLKVLRLKIKGYVTPQDVANAIPGDTPQTDRLQKAFDTVADDHGVLMFDNVYAQNAPLYLRDNLSIDAFSNGRLLRRWSGQRQITQESFAQTVKNVTIRNITIGAESLARVGQGLFAWLENSVIEHLTVDTFASNAQQAGQAIMLGGYNITMLNPRTKNPLLRGGTGGLRLMGGADIKVYGGLIISGDDAIQFAPLANGDIEIVDQSLERCYYFGTSAWSLTARPFVCFLINNRSYDITMTSSIRNCGFVGVTGRGNMPRALYIGNLSSTGFIEGISFQGTVDMVNANSVRPGPLAMISRKPGTGRIYNLDIRADTNGINQSLAYVALAERVRMRFTMGGPPEVEAQATSHIAGINNANPAIVNVFAHAFTTGTQVFIEDTLDMPELDETFCTVTVIDDFNLELDGVDTTLLAEYDSRGGTLTKGCPIEGITLGATTTILSASHQYVTGDRALVKLIPEGPTELNFNAYDVIAHVPGVSFTLNVDSSALDAWVSGGVVLEVRESALVMMRGTQDCSIVESHLQQKPGTDIIQIASFAGVAAEGNIIRDNLMSGLSGNGGDRFVYGVNVKSGKGASIVNNRMVRSSSTDTTLKTRAVNIRNSAIDTVITENDMSSMAENRIIFGEPAAKLAITGVTLGNPTVLTVVAHGLIGDETARTSDILGTVELNNRETIITVVDADHVSIPIDSTSFTAYASGGFLNFDGTFVAMNNPGSPDIISSLRSNPKIETYANIANFSIAKNDAAEIIYLTGAITGNRTLTLLTTDAKDGDHFRIVTAGSGAFTWDIGPGLYTLASSGQFCDVYLRNGAWVKGGTGTA